MRRSRSLTAPILFALVVAACSGPSGPVAEDADPHLAYALSLAEASGTASDSQLEVLRLAVETGTLSFDDYRAAIETTLGCMEDAGIPTAGPDPDESWGFLRLTYAAMTGDVRPSSPDDAEETGGLEDDADYVPSGTDPTGETDLSRIANACRDTHSAFVELAYEEQPSSLAAADAYLETRRAEILACAQEFDLEADETLPIRDLLAQVVDQGEYGRECLHRSEISAF